jgi:hypothetical protein
MCQLASSPPVRQAQRDVRGDQPQVVGVEVGGFQRSWTPAGLTLAEPAPARSGRTKPVSTSYFRSVSICSCSPVAMV